MAGRAYKLGGVLAIFVAIAVAAGLVALKRHSSSPGQGAQALSAAQTVAGSAAGAAEQPAPPLPPEEQTLSFPQFGRYAIRVSSPQGTGLQLIDRMTGPGPQDGGAGQRDGRIDGFFGPGDIKAVLQGLPGAAAATVTATPFAERTTPLNAVLTELQDVQTELNDLEQHSYWLTIPRRQTVFLEAAGRALADLRLWKDGVWLVPDQPAAEISSQDPAHPLAVRRLVATLEPGLYRLSAYGGPGLAWADGITASPLVLRWGIPALSANLRHQLRTGLTGYDRWLVSGTDLSFRLELPAGVQGTIEVGTYQDGQITGAILARIEKDNRSPVAELVRNSGQLFCVTVRTKADQAYHLETFSTRQDFRLPETAAGPYLLAATRPGLNEDDPDLTAVLGATDSAARLSLVQDQTIALGPDHPWRRRFNLLDTVTLFVRIAKAGRYRAEVTGGDASLTWEPYAQLPISGYRGAGTQSRSGVWSLEEGLSRLTLRPALLERGIITLSLHAEGAPAASENAAPLPPLVSFAPVQLDAGKRYTLTLNQPTGMLLLPLPLTLDSDIPLALAGGEQKTLPLQLTQGGQLAVTTAQGKNYPFRLDGANPVTQAIPVQPGRHQLDISNPTAGPVLLSLHVERPLPPRPVAQLTALDPAQNRPPMPELQPGQPLALDLDRAEKRSFLVKVTEAALYRIETTGLLETSGLIRTQTETTFRRAIANGTGRNMLVQRYLRPGSYLLTVQAEGRTRGHLGLQMTTAPLRDLGRLSLDLPAHAAQTAGEGLVYHLELAQAGRTRIRVIAPSAAVPAETVRSEDSSSGSDAESEADSDSPPARRRTVDPAGVQLRYRLEDAQGWPLTGPDQRGDFTQDLRAGSYRLIVEPAPLPGRVLLLASSIGVPPARDGHGPHLLPLGETVQHRWDEPAAGQPRQPDQWRLTLPAQADLHLSLSEGMGGQIVALSDGAVLARFSFREEWHGRLDAGQYRIETSSIRPNNRLDYRLSSRLTQLVAGQTRDVSLPARIPLALGGERRVEITSFGPSPLTAVLEDAEQREILRARGNDQDWNIGIATRLKAGQYSLRLEPVGTASGQTTIRLRDLTEEPEDPLMAGQTRTFADGQLHSLPLSLPDGTDPALLVGAAVAAEPVGLALEQQDAQGQWQTVQTSTGSTAFLGLPRPAAGTSGQHYRLQVWPVGGHLRPVAVGLALPSPVPLPESALTRGLPVATLPTLPVALQVGVVQPDGAGLWRLDNTDGVVQGDQNRGRALKEAGTVVAVSEAPFWFLLPPGHASLRGHRIDPAADQTVPLELEDGQHIHLPARRDQRGPVLWLADSRVGQPGLDLTSGPQPADARRGGTDQGSAAALQVDGQTASVLQLWRADSPAPMPVSLRQIGFTRPDERNMAWGAGDDSLAPLQAAAYRLPAGLKRLQLALPPGLAAGLLDQDGQLQRLIWSASRPQSVLLETAAVRLLLLNSRSDQEQIGWTLSAVVGHDGQPAQPALQLSAGALLRQTRPVAGLLLADIPAPPRPMRLMLSGPVQEAWLVQADGQIQNGTAGLLVDKAASLWLRHDPGQIIAVLQDPLSPNWLEQARRADIRAVPASLTLEGNSMAWRVISRTPALLHLRSTQPVMTAHVRARSDTPQQVLWPTGGNLALYLPPEQETLVGVRPLLDASLSGQADLSVSPSLPLQDGAGPLLRLAPGEARLFSFTVQDNGPVGFGVRGEADSVRIRLWREDGQPVAEGAMIMPALNAGRYVMNLENRADAQAVAVQPVLVGLQHPDKTPPEDVRAHYWSLVTAGGEP